MDAGFLNSVRSFKFTSRKHRISDDDAVDRVNSFYTPIIIVLLSTVVMTKMYLVGQPIECWIPREFSEAWEQYVESYCWVKNTYFVAPNDSIPDSATEKKKEELMYYQWVPFVLGLQALLFYLPSFVWKIMNWQSGIQIKTLVSMATSCVDDSQDGRQNKIELLARHVEYSIVNELQPSNNGVLSRVKRYSKRALLCGLASSASYLTAVYLIVKLLYIVNCVGQFWLLNRFLNTDYDFYGVQVLMDLWNNRDWRHSGHFPRVTLCDFNIRAVGNIHPRTIQCVLVVNLLNEKIFIFLWFLLLAVSILTILDALDWLIWTLISSRRHRGLRRYISPQSREEEQLFLSFCNRHLKPDGAFVLRMLNKNAGGPVVRDVLQQLWQRYCGEQLSVQHTPPQSDASFPEATAPLADDSDEYDLKADEAQKY